MSKIVREYDDPCSMHTTYVLDCEHRIIIEYEEVEYHTSEWLEKEVRNCAACREEKRK